MTLPRLTTLAAVSMGIVLAMLVAAPRVAAHAGESHGNQSELELVEVLPLVGVVLVMGLAYQLYRRRVAGD